MCNNGWGGFPRGPTIGAWDPETLRHQVSNLGAWPHLLHWEGCTEPVLLSSAPRPPSAPWLGCWLGGGAVLAAFLCPRCTGVRGFWTGLETDHRKFQAPATLTLDCLGNQLRVWASVRNTDLNLKVTVFGRWDWVTVLTWNVFLVNTALKTGQWSGWRVSSVG